MMKTFLAYFLSTSLIVPGSAPGSVSAIAQAHPAASSSGATAATAVDGGWPRAYTTSSGATLVLYEPQVASWPDQKSMVVYAAVSYAARNQPSPTLGTIRVEAKTKVAVDERLVNFSDLEITSANFPTLQRDELKAVVDEIKSIPMADRVLGLDRVLAAIDASEIQPKNIAGMSTEPPPIFFSKRLAVLVNIDGEPIWSPIADTHLRYAVNTNWDLFEDPGSPKAYYLRIEHGWMTASAVEGPWTVPHTALPAGFSKLPNDDNWKDVKQALAAPTPKTNLGPTVFVSTRPAELMVLNGGAQYTPVPGTQLQWVNNTESDVFRVGTNGPVYFLVSGRWFSAPDFSGPWTFATPNLPDDFKRIPLEHPRSRVLASVPGTTQALEAVLLAQIPQTARVSRKETHAPEVVYQGDDPQFETIANTSVARALNTDKDVIMVGDTFYLCADGVWFKGSSPTGPFEVATSVPPEIYEIPIESPSHHVTYVTIEDSNDDDVWFAAAAAYTGLMVGWGCAMWGTGYYYPPYYWGGGYFPASFPTYGYGARYNPWSGAYTRGGAVYGPYGGAGYAARYNPRTGTYARGAAAWGPGGAVGGAQAWNPRTGTFAQTRQGSNVYGSWGATAVQRGDQWAATARATNRATGATTRATRGSEGGGMVSRSGAAGRTSVGRTDSGNIYAGHDGSVYRKQGDSWQKYNNGNWNNVDRPVGTSGGKRADGISSTTRDQLNRDYSSRSEGARRTNDLGSVKSRGGSSGSYRPSGGFSGGGFRGGGGGFRGGGGRRR